MRTVPLDTFDPVDALDLLEMGFGDPGRQGGLDSEALDTALERHGWQRPTPWSQGPGGPRRRFGGSRRSQRCGQTLDGRHAMQ
ncbi:hypothetical protein MO973_16445 [Paenibacillus sp. TRM 82003]|nr:hypothetical protein [Paenibacillus sp. TRM 82003]